MIVSLQYFTWFLVYINRNVFFAWFDENQLHKISKEYYWYICYTVWGSGDQGNEPVNIAATYGFIVKSMRHWS